MEFEITKDDKENINGCFTKYLFYKREKNGDMECWCSHCNKHFRIPFYSRTKTQSEINLYSQAVHNEEVVCPHCNQEAIAKSIGKAKECKNLWEEQRAVIIRKVDYNRVNAQSLYCYKEYCKGHYLPEVELRGFRQYEFTPEKAVCLEKGWYRDEYYPCKHFLEPFRAKSSNWYYICDNTYKVFGIEELEDSFLKYNQLDSFYKSYFKNQETYITDTPPLMKYLCWFTVYPQIEMLQKLGYKKIVNLLVGAGIKSFPYLNWKGKNIADFFRLTKQEYKEFQKVTSNENGMDYMDYLKVHYILKKNKHKCDAKTIEKYYKAAGGCAGLERAQSILKKLKEPIMPGIDYLLAQYKKEGNGGFANYLIFFEDYREMVKDLKLGDSEEVKYPPHLVAAHDRAVEMRNALKAEIEAKKQKEVLKKYKKIHVKNEKQYSFSADGFVIIVPPSAKEIIEEGKNMRHCVGGYAERHLNGTLTILFLREASKPKKSLYTIEMHGKHLAQVQGYRNRTLLTDEAKAFFDKWLSWVKDGSPRTEKGTPIIKETVKKTA